MKYIINNHNSYELPYLFEHKGYGIENLPYRVYELSPLEEIIERHLTKYEVPNKQL